MGTGRVSYVVPHSMEFSNKLSEGVGVDHKYLQWRYVALEGEDQDNFPWRSLCLWTDLVGDFDLGARDVMDALPLSDGSLVKHYGKWTGNFPSEGDAVPEFVVVIGDVTSLTAGERALYAMSWPEFTTDSYYISIQRKDGTWLDAVLLEPGKRVNVSHWEEFLYDGINLRVTAANGVSAHFDFEIAACDDTGMGLKAVNVPALPDSPEVGKYLLQAQWDGSAWTKSWAWQG